MTIQINKNIILWFIIINGLLISINVCGSILFYDNITMAGSVMDRPFKVDDAVSICLYWAIAEIAVNGVFAAVVSMKSMRKQYVFFSLLIVVLLVIVGLLVAYLTDPLYLSPAVYLFDPMFVTFMFVLSLLIVGTIFYFAFGR